MGSLSLVDLDLRQCFVVICTAGPSTVPTHSRGLLRQCVWDDLIVDKGRGLGICQVWLRMSQGIEVTQRQYCAKYLMFSSYLNLIRPPGGRTISIFFFFFKGGNRLRSDKFAGATKTKYHRMGDLTGIYFSHFGRLSIQDQGAIRVDF